MNVSGKWACAALDFVFRLGVGGVFIYAALAKIQDPALFAHAVSSYRILPSVFVGPFALVLPMLELVAGCGLIVTKWPREAAVVLLGLLGVFLVGLVQAAVRGLDISCGCFGESADAAQHSIGGAIVRDLLLFAPTAWIACRPNYWLLRRFSRGRALLFAALLTGGLFAEPQPTVQPETWTKDFPAALAQARATHHPLVSLASSERCPYCLRIRKVIDGKPFREWLTGTGIYLAEAHAAETNASPTQLELFRFVEDAKSAHPCELMGTPFIGVYWLKPSGEEVRVTFTGRRSCMPGEAQASLTGEFTSAIGKVLADYLKSLQAPPPSVETILKSAAVKRIQCASQGNGKVQMSPPSGEMVDAAGTVRLIARRGRTSAFTGWIGPDGKSLPRNLANRPILTINYDMAEGVYTAVFKDIPARNRTPRRTPRAPERTNE